MAITAFSFGVMAARPGAAISGVAVTTAVERKTLPSPEVPGPPPEVAGAAGTSSRSALIPSWWVRNVSV